MDTTNLRYRIGELVRQHRQNRNYSQQALAAICGMNRSYVGALERGEHNVSLANLARIAAGLEISLTRLLGEAARQASQDRVEQHRERRQAQPPERVVLHREQFMMLLRECAADRPDLVAVYLERCGVNFIE